MSKFHKFDICFAKKGGLHHIKHPLVMLEEKGDYILGVQLTSDSSIKGEKVYQLYKNPQKSYAVNAVYAYKKDGCSPTKHGTWELSEEDRRLVRQIFSNNKMKVRY